MVPLCLSRPVLSRVTTIASSHLLAVRCHRLFSTSSTLRILHPRRFLSTSSSSSSLATPTTVTSTSTPSVALAEGGCGAGCACAQKREAGASNDTSSLGSSGCGSGSCACSTSANNQKEDEETQVQQAELASLQSEVSRLFSLGEYDVALTRAERANTLALALFGVSHPATASTYNNLALIHRVYTCDYEEAARMQESALESYRTSVGEEHSSYITVAANLALTYRSLSLLPRAYTLLSSVLSTLSRTLPESELRTSLQFAHASAYMASVLKARQQSGDLTEALSLYDRALRIVQRREGTESVLAASMLNNIGLTHKDAKDYERALQYYQQSLGIRTRNLPPRHPDIIVTLHNIAECLKASGDEQKSLLVQQKILDIMSTTEADHAEADDHKDHKHQDETERGEQTHR